MKKWHEKIQIPASTGAIIAVIGTILMLLSWSWMKLSTYQSIWVEILNTTSISPFTLFLAYAGMIISSGLISMGVLVMIFSDQKAELPTQKLNMDYIRNEIKQSKKATRLEKLSHFFFFMEFIVVIVIGLQGFDVLPRIHHELLLITSLFVFLVLGIILYEVDKRKKVQV